MEEQEGLKKKIDENKNLIQDKLNTISSIYEIIDKKELGNDTTVYLTKAKKSLEEEIRELEKETKEYVNKVDKIKGENTF